MCKRAGPIVDLLLEHVAHVQLCSRLTELLDSQEEWLTVKRKSCKRSQSNVITHYNANSSFHSFTSSHTHMV